ncbi:MULTISPECIES: ZIP family metal transporter [Borreliella]|uniref:GufA protein n=2 Tax=Borreliella TaxID=64895 RepID=A0A7I6GVT6_BORGP|nr:MULTISPECIES: ZIP family metal transporter [Borreliella]AAU07076.1 gufA protein [Borreliella bavariensis PBi]AFT83551.1 gufA protein [Borreliella garinii NMJW1]AHZ74321.1 dihydroorotate dehydrogenase [Borreliella garinii SZ]AZA26900.1 ZIP family metal transporter [Borreliella bavariensis PBi]WLN23894.1 ZIP family metal transporter [Borreliella bavariensis]
MIKSILDYLLTLHPVLLGLLGSTFTWFTTAFGAGAVFFFRKVDNKIMDAMLGFSAGIMIAASFFSLIQPAIERAEELGYITWIPAVFGFLVGAFFIYIVDVFVPDLDKLTFIDEDLTKHGKKDFLLFTAVTLHNFPEGLAVGVAFGALASNPDIQTLVGAMLLTLGIGIQNIPEGAAISLPLRRGNVALIKCFNYGQMSGLVEIVGGLMGAYAVYSFTRILPFALAFSAGAMIYVSIEQLIPEAKRKDIDNKVPSIFGVIGFTLMMFLDVSLG